MSVRGGVDAKYRFLCVDIVHGEWQFQRQTNRQPNKANDISNVFVNDVERTIGLNLLKGSTYSSEGGIVFTKLQKLGCHGC